MPTSSSGGGILLILAPSPSRRLPHPPPRAAPRASHLDTTTRARRAHPASPSSPAWLRWTPATHLRLLPRPWRGLCSGRTHTTRRSPSRCTPTATSSLDRDPGDPSSSPVVRIGSLSSSSPADRISKEIEERRSKMPGVLYYGRVPPSEPREPDSPSSPETQFVGDEYSPSSLPLLDQSANMLDTVMRISSLQLDENNPTLPLLHPDHEMWSDCEDYAPDSPERHSSDDEMVQNRRLYDYEGRLQRQSDDYANLALEHYNNNEKNKLKEN